jgi:hypothetical protein
MTKELKWHTDYRCLTSSAMAEPQYSPREKFKLPPDDPKKCKARVVRHNTNPKGNHIIGYYYKEQCSRDNGKGPNGDYCWQHAKTLTRKFGA